LGNQTAMFALEAEVGLTKHIGGFGATAELIELCHLDKAEYVVDVGCGAGVTSCYLAHVPQVDALTADGWEGLLEGAGLGDVVARAHRTDEFSEAGNRVKRHGLAAILGAPWRALILPIKNPVYRRLPKESETMTERRLVPYDTCIPGFEAVYTGERRPVPNETTDEHGRVIERWPLWPYGGKNAQRDAFVALLNRMQTELGPLEENIRQIRAHIASLTPCDTGLPVTVDEALRAIGQGKLPEPSFRNGCYYGGMWWETKSTQPRQLECLRAVHEIVTARLAGRTAEELVLQYPYACTFVRHTYAWLPVLEDLTEIQTLLVERMLLPFEFFTTACHADPVATWPEGARQICDSVLEDCYEGGGRGSEIDAEIERLAGLPKIEMAFPRRARQAVIDDPAKMDLYVLCCSLAHGLHTLCDCHHSTFRWIENWIYAVGTGRWGILDRKGGTERERLGRLLFGYLLGIDKWLLGIPHQFLLLDLGHIDVGFDPKNEIVRVYAYLGEERTPAMEWLVGALWHNLMYNTGGLVWGGKHQSLIDRADEAGVSVQEWMDGRLEGKHAANSIDSLES